MSFFLVFVAIVLAAVAILVGTDLVPRIFRRGSGEQPFNDGFDEPVASLPAVLLPADADPADIDRIRFAVGVRGYRMDQVDQVLDDLRDQIASKDREIARLRTELERPELARPELERPARGRRRPEGLAPEELEPEGLAPEELEPEGRPERNRDAAADPAP